MTFNEVKECCKGHVELSWRLSGESLNFIGKRHVGRLMSDAYGKGIVRGQVENTNLRALAKSSDVTFAECIRTSPTMSFYGKEYVDIVQQLFDRSAQHDKAIFVEVDARNKKHRRVTTRDVATLHGQRPRVASLWFLSPYAFVMQWEAVLVSYPLTLKDSQHSRHHVKLTDAGTAKMRMKEACGVDVELEAGDDYLIEEEGTFIWGPFPNCAATQHFRHTWVLQRRKRAIAPSFVGAPVPKSASGEAERNAMIALAYFRPWTLRQDDAEDHVPFTGSMREPNSTWTDSFEAWINGNILCEESKRYLNNFWQVYRFRPDNDDAGDMRSDEEISDEELEMSHDLLHEALTTRIGGNEISMEQDDDVDNVGGTSHKANSIGDMKFANQAWGDRHVKEHIDVKDAVFSPMKNLKTVLDAAKASRGKEKSFQSL